MTAREPVRVGDIASFDTLIDARSPAEFALDHIPGAINCPVLDDEERRIVGTLYKQKGAFEARRVGGAMVAANLARHLREQFAERPAQWKPLVYCWRGGLRSGAMVNWLRLVGWDAQQLAGGYKRYRGHVIEQIAQLCPRLPLVVLCGATGSAKTRLLQHMAQQGAQVLDLEALACHRGSLLGAWRGRPQPSQKHFETLLADQLQRLDLAQPVFIEGESARIGRLSLPTQLVERMREAPVVELQATLQARLAYLLHDYADLGEDRQALAQLMAHFTPSLGKETVARWQAWALEGALAPLFGELMALHYDPHYARSHARYFRQWDARTVHQADDLGAPALQALAGRLLDR
ncbi:tRNA 2-selenouridine(34) synthase MnmH [Xenophilus arseniciresistens]|uniref:tRNA 2-selenouridine(34) synthase MnmH n=1 Tax=Xenophilus arseniciresistens TaxID=1283306 RepID=A0AAE3N436_9BURK|nr:tRNA 2-selenouridine(34) synthase MnmH [Xenophilus arseniciresistens]MDA7415150.1 tRNA 2-selenouridine(34) synthase MnmH [Xenophilus arseniciresistens]